MVNATYGVSTRPTGGPSHRRLEEAADALARFDLACSTCSPAFSLALRLAAISDLAQTGLKGTRALAAAFAEAAVGVLNPVARRWSDFIDEEERRARGGAPLTIARLQRAGPLPFEADPRRLSLVEHALRPGPDVARPAALHRALAVSAAIGERGLGEAAAALVLCAEGRTDRVRCLPFALVAEDERDVATAAWREGDESAWTRLGLDALIASSRGRRAALDRATSASASEDRLLDALGRAAINARRALKVLRRDLITTVPTLATELALSRPAADDAVARLAEAHVATELTGRKRDRVFAYAAALAITE